MTHEHPDAVHKTFTSNSFDSSNAVMMVMNHPVLDLIRDILNAPEIVQRTIDDDQKCKLQVADSFDPARRFSEETDHLGE
jgi:hypothetical protein